MDNSEFYDRLGIDKNANADQIKQAYRKQSKKYHPDLNKEPGAEDQYKKIQEAYETLSDPQKKQMYDQYGATDGQGGNPFGGGGNPFGGFSSGGFSFSSDGDIDLGDIFSQMFGGRVDPNRPRAGEDLVYRLHLNFEDAIFGKTTKIKYPRPMADGSQETHEVEVKIPAGVDDGQRLRLEGQGSEGFNGGPYGDLFVAFRVDQKNADGLIRDGRDIRQSIELSLTQAILGDEIQIKTVHGDVELKIPAGTQPGTEFRIKGKGVEDLRTGAMGDHFVEADIKIPTKLSKKQRELIEEFDDAGKKKGLFG